MWCTCYHRNNVKCLKKNTHTRKQEKQARWQSGWEGGQLTQLTWLSCGRDQVKHTNPRFDYYTCDSTELQQIEKSGTAIQSSAAPIHVICSAQSFAVIKMTCKRKNIHTKQTEAAQNLVVVLDSRGVTVVNRGRNLLRQRSYTFLSKYWKVSKFSDHRVAGKRKSSKQQINSNLTVDSLSATCPKLWVHFRTKNKTFKFLGIILFKYHTLEVLK